jgi:cytochrome c peroxidase
LPAAVDSAANPVTGQKVALGRMLYYDPRLSKGHDVSCNTCHNLDDYGIDEEPLSSGHKGQKGSRNSPTVYNAAGHIAQFWDGRAPTIEEQAKGPVLNPVEMAMPAEKQVIAVLKSMPEYVAAFREAFPGEKDPVTFDNMARAIGAFERGLLTPGRWDKFLAGDSAALLEAEKTGLNKFLDAGCHACHSGPYLGGAMYQKLGLVKPWPESHDLGRFGITKQEADKMMFKVPSLRNIQRTGPYFHDGSVTALETAVSSMAEHQLGKQLARPEIESILEWMKSLTGEIPQQYVKAPALPKSTEKTPKPEKI